MNRAPKSCSEFQTSYRAYPGRPHCLSPDGAMIKGLKRFCRRCRTRLAVFVTGTAPDEKLEDGPISVSARTSLFS